jgi:DNA-binding response OmpR family regulator
LTLSNFKAASALVYDQKRDTRWLTMSLLRGMGFGLTKVCARAALLEATLANQLFDLLVAEIESVDCPTFELIKRLRKADFGHDPFVPIILTTWEPTKTITKQALDSGADDLLIRPFSAAHLRQRIEFVIENRRGFVRTGDYLGPDRRRDPKRLSEEGLVAVPNALKLKVVDEALAPTDEAISTAMDELNRERLLRNTAQIEGLVDTVITSFEKRRHAADVRAVYFETLELINKDLFACTEEVGLSYIAKLSAALSHIVDRVRGMAPDEVTDRHLKLLHEGARAIDTAVNHDRDERAATEIAERVTTASGR